MARLPKVNLFQIGTFLEAGVQRGSNTQFEFDLRGLRHLDKNPIRQHAGDTSCITDVGGFGPADLDWGWI
jgi:hypothetical protein